MKLLCHIAARVINPPPAGVGASLKSTSRALCTPTLAAKLARRLVIAKNGVKASRYLPLGCVLVFGHLPQARGMERQLRRPMDYVRLMRRASFSMWLNSGMDDLCIDLLLSLSCLLVTIYFTRDHISALLHRVV